MNSTLSGPEKLIVAAVLVYVGLCFAVIADKHGKSPFLGLLAVISPFNLIILGIWAFGKFERKEKSESE